MLFSHPEGILARTAVDPLGPPLWAPKSDKKYVVSVGWYLVRLLALFESRTAPKKAPKMMSKWHHTDSGA